MEEQNQKQSLPKPQPEKTIKVDFSGRRKMIGVIVWIIMGIIVGLLSSNINYDKKNGSYCGSHNTGFPFTIKESVPFQFNSNPINYLPNLVSTAYAIIIDADCGFPLSNDLVKEDKNINIFKNILIFSFFFVLVELINWKYKKNILYLINLVFIFLLYIIAI